MEIMSVMKDPADGEERDNLTSRKASFMEPANPTGEFLRWGAGAANQHAHSEPWQQPPRKNETVVWSVRACACVCVCVCKIVLTSVWVKSVSVWLITSPTKPALPLLYSDLVWELVCPFRSAVYTDHYGWLFSFHEWQINWWPHECIITVFYKHAARAAQYSRRCVCINTIQQKICPSWIRQKLIVEQLMCR